MFNDDFIAMYLQQAQIRNFRGILSADIALDAGVNVLFGPNESGKSTFLTALGAAFFLNADASSREAKSFRSWGSAADPQVRLRFIAGSNEYEVEKTFLGERKGRLVCAATGLDTGNKDRISAELATLMPLHTSDGQSMRNTFWIEQQQLEATVQTLQKDANLRTVLQNVMFRNSGDIEEIKRVVKKQVKDLGIGTRGAAAKNPGPIARAEADARRLGEEVERMQRELVLVQEETERLQVVEQQLAEVNRTVEEDRQLLDTERRYSEAKRRRDEANRALDDIIETIARYDRARETIVALRERVRELEGRQKSTESVLEMLKRSEEIPRTEDTIRRGQEILDDVRDINKQIAEIIRQQAGSRAVEKADYEQARRLEQLVLRKREALDAVQMSVEVRPLRTVDVAARADEKIVHNAEIPGGGTETFRAGRTLRLAIGGVGDIIVSTGAGDAAKLQYELEDAERELTTLLRKHNADAFSILEERYNRQQQLAVERELLENQRAGRLGRHTVERIEAGIVKYRADIEALRREHAALGLQPGETAATRQQQTIELVRQLGEATAELRQLEEAVATFTARFGTPENAQEQRLLSAREAAKADIVFGDLPAVDVEPGELVRVRERFETYQREQERLTREYHTLQGSLQHADVSSDRLHLKQAELEDARALQRRFQLEFDAYRAIEIAIDETEQEIADQLTEPVEKLASTLLPELTEGRYAGFTLDKDLRIVAVRYEGAEVRPDELSTGAQGQLALAIRLALIRHIAGNERQTVIIDDALVHFDTPRLGEAKMLLSKFSDEHQIIYMSCHERMRDWPGAKVIAVSRYRWQE